MTAVRVCSLTDLKDDQPAGFTVGGVPCIGRRLCEPCAHLERLSPGTLRPLVHRGGLRADLLGDSAIHVGDSVSA